MRKRRSGRWHTIYSVISTLVEEIAIAALLLWILPSFGVRVPAWAVVAVLAGFAVFSYIMYRVGHPTVLYSGVNDPDSIVGSTGMVEIGRASGELWKSSCPGCQLKQGDEVTVTAIDGLSLTVAKKV